MNDENPTPSQPSANKIFDVAKPGQFTPATATSRPVIVSNRPIMRDPMMTTADMPPEAAADGSAPVAVKVTIKPLAADAKVAETVAPAPPVIVEDTVSPKPLSPPNGQDATNPEDANITDGTQAAQAAAALEAEQKQQAELDELVDKKQYFLPVNSIEKRRSRLTTGFGLVLIIILGLALINFMLDAGFIHIAGLKSVTHFFSAP